MILFTPEMKKNIEDGLREMNDELEHAFDQAERGGDAYGAAGEAVVRIRRMIDKKHDIITSFPGIEVKAGVEVPFFALYETFYDLDRFADVAAGLMVAIHGHAAGASPPIDEQRKRTMAGLANSAKELEVNLIDKYQFDDPEALDALKQMRESLNEIHDLLDGANADDGASWQRVDELRQRLRALKKRFFDCFNAPMPLWDAYALLASIDDELDWSGSLIGQYLPADSRRARMGRGALRAAIDTKRKLEVLVHGTDTKDVKAWIGGLPADSHEPPVYPPELRDLAPFDVAAELGDQSTGTARPADTND